MRLYMRYSIPMYLEARLCSKFGYTVESKKFNDSIVFVKTNKKTGIQKHTPKVVAEAQKTLMFGPELDQKAKNALDNRCDNIVDHYPDPYSVIPAVRQRLLAMGSTLPLAQRQHVLEFVDRHFPLDYHERKAMLV